MPDMLAQLGQNLGSGGDKAMAMERGQALWAVVGLCLGLSAPATPAAASFKLCNQSYDVLNIAIAQPDPDEFAEGADGPDQAEGSGMVSRGWWRVAPNQCATLVRERLRSRFFYIFAADVFGKEALSGAIPLCVAPGRFVIARQGDCLLRGYLDARFLEVDTEEQSDWTVFVSPRPS